MPSSIQRKLPVELTKKLMSYVCFVEGVAALMGKLGTVLERSSFAQVPGSGTFQAVLVGVLVVSALS